MHVRWAANRPRDVVQIDHIPLWGVKSRIGPLLRRQRSRTAAISIKGIELLLRIRKGQFNLTRLRLSE